MIREEGFRLSVTEITPSLESGVAGDMNHPGRHQQAGGVAQPNGWVQLGVAAVTPTAGVFCFLFFAKANHNVLRGPRHGAVKPLDSAKGANMGKIHL